MYLIKYIFVFFFFFESSIYAEQTKTTKSDYLSEITNFSRELMSTPEGMLVLQYMELHKQCESKYVQNRFLNENKEKFVKNRKLAKSAWTKFLNEDYDNELNSRFESYNGTTISEVLKSFTKETLEEKIIECRNRFNSIVTELREFEVNLMKVSPHFKSLNLKFKNSRKSSLKENDNISKSQQKDFVEIPEKLMRTDEVLSQITKKNIVYLKNNEIVASIEPIKEALKDMTESYLLCKQMENSFRNCICNEKESRESLEYLISDVLLFNPDLKNNIYFDLDDKGGKSNRFSITSTLASLDNYNQLCN